MERKIIITASLGQPLKIEVEFYANEQDWQETALEEIEKMDEILHYPYPFTITAKKLKEDSEEFEGFYAQYKARA